METSFAERSERNEAHSSGVSWSAVIGGAVVTAALSVILLSLGTGLGLSSVSPWSNVGASASAVGKGVIVWLIVMQLVASATGGYLAGRLRTKWATIHTDEVYFRDTAHGFLAWATGLVITVYFLASGAATMVGGVAQAGAMGAAAGEGRASSHNGYFVDTLFRSEHPGTERNEGSVHGEVERVLVNALRRDSLPNADKTYLAQLIAARTGLSQAEAEKRISDVVAEARRDADAAREAAAHLLLWIFIALLIGAFSASYAATIGGRQRDHVKLI